MDSTLRVLGYPDHEMDIIVDVPGFDDGMAVHSTPSWNVFERTWIRCKHGKNCSWSQFLDDLLRTNYREGTKKSTDINGLHGLIMIRHANWVLVGAVPSGLPQYLGLRHSLRIQ